MTVGILTSCATPYEWVAYPSAGALADLTADQWREDVEYLRTELPARNPHFDEDAGMAATFDAAALALEDAIDETTTPDVVVAEVSRLLALVGEGHTSLNSYPTSVFPVIASWFADGFYVAGADREYEEIVGAKIVGIRDALGTLRSLAEIEPMLNAVISADHPNGYHPSYSQLLSDPYIMRGLGLADASGLTYQLDQGGTITEATVAEKAGNEVDVVRASDSAPNTPLPSRSNEPNWYVRTGPDDMTIYLSYADCRAEAMDLFQDLVNELESSSVDRLIVDIRRNSGGTSVPGSWLASQLAGVPGLDSPGDIFVLIGPVTFSSGMMLAVDLMDKTNAIFAGQPLAESPNSWGEVKRFPLPNSGLMIGHSTRFFEYGRGKNLRLDADGMLVPDDGFVIDRTFEEYQLGIDPVVEAALSYGR
jgi:hypothetical protein